jgi:hypothetical protein
VPAAGHVESYERAGNIRDAAGPSLTAPAPPSPPELLQDRPARGRSGKGGHLEGSMPRSAASSNTVCKASCKAAELGQDGPTKARGRR